MTMTGLRTPDPTPAAPADGDGTTTAATAETPGGRRGRLLGIVRGRDDEPAWARPALLVLLAGTALLYLWNLSASGTANSFYAAAVQAGTKSWKALFFGSLDSSNFITVDKPPASLWIMGLCGRVFGFNSWSLLAPQAVEGVAAVGLLYTTVRRWSGPAAGLLAGAVLALTPAAALMFRFDNPDALLVLLLVAGAYCVVRALEAGATRWLLLAGTALGFAFLTKMLQGFLVLPAFALVYLVAAPTPLRRRIGQLLGAGGALIVSAGWWVAVVELWPASSRPYIGGSTDNNVLELVLGYNGFGRLLGGSGNSSGNGGGGGTGTSGSSFGGATGLARLFSSEMGNEISWLLPAALVALVAGLWITRRAPRADRTRAALLLWGASLLVTGIVFSYMEGTIHPYYTVALAPSIAALVAVGGRALWQQRTLLTARIGLAAMLLAAGGWSFVLLARDSSWYPGLRYAALALTVSAAVGLLVPAHRLRKASAALLIAGIIGGLGGSAAYAGATAASVHTGSIPSVGPAGAASSTGGMGGMGGTGAMGGTEGGGGTRPTGAGGATASGKVPSGTMPSGTMPSGTMPSGTSAGGGTTTSTALRSLLAKSTTRWAAAVIGDQSAADLELSSGTAVMAIGGWSGGDDAPTLAQFEADVSAGEIHYFIAGSTGGGGGGSTGTSSAITTWVTAHYKATTVGGQTVYDLTAATTS